MAHAEDQTVNEDSTSEHAPCQLTRTGHDMFTQLLRELKFRIEKELETQEELAKNDTLGAYREPGCEPGPITKVTAGRAEL